MCNIFCQKITQNAHYVFCRTWSVWSCLYKWTKATVWSNLRDSVSSAEKAVAPHSSTLAWKIPWTEDPGGLQSMGSRRVWHDWATTFTFHFHAFLEKEMATHSSVLAWRIPGTGEPGGLSSMGSHRVGHNWSDLAAAAAIKSASPSFSPQKVL